LTSFRNVVVSEIRGLVIEFGITAENVFLSEWQAAFAPKISFDAGALADRATNRRYEGIVRERLRHRAGKGIASLLKGKAG